MQRFTKYAAAGFAAAALLAVGAPAFAATAGNPGAPTGAGLPATVTIQTPTIALSMSSTSLAINTQPGVRGNATGPVLYSVDSYDPTGYKVLIDAADLVGLNPANKLLASDLTDAWSVSPPPSGQSGSGSLTLPEGDVQATVYSNPKETGNQDNGAGSDSVTENWSVQTPGSQPADTYSTTINYTAMGT